MFQFKKITALLLVLMLLLSGCVADPQEATGSATAGTTQNTQATVQTTQPGETTEPAGEETVSTQPTEAATDPTEAPTEPTQTEEPTQPTEEPTQPTEAPTEPSVEPTQPDDPADDTDWSVDPYVDMTAEEFYADYTTASCYMDSYWRTQHYFMSGSLEVPGQYMEYAAYQPMDGDLYIRNTDAFYLDDGNTYVVVDSYGVEVMRIYKGGAYITLEEVAAYMYAFGGSNADLPANYTSSTKTKPTSSPWGIYLRVNHSYFTGDTSRYPYEPELPNISGCGGSLQYWELDIGTTGTVTPGYSPALYNNGSKITRGAARIVYARQDLNGNGVYEQDEIYVFYTFNHYNDFVEYLNYYGGWGEVFGNVTGGGEYSSKTNCNPTPYVPTAYASFSE